MEDIGPATKLVPTVSRLTDPETKRIIAKIKIKNGFKKKDVVVSDIKPSVGTSDS